MKRLHFFIVSLFFLFIGCNSSNIQDQNTVNTPTPSATPLTFLALGDSYTIGESVSEDKRWPVQLVEELTQEDINIISPKIIATTGWTTAELQEGIANSIAAGEVSAAPYDLVSLLIGVNNQYRGYDFAIYEKEFEELLRQAITFAGGNASKVFVVSIPDYGVTPFASGSNQEKIATEIDQYNAKAQAIAEQYQVAYIDITPISRQASNDRELIAPDGLHPSGKMYAAWVSSIKPVVRAILD